MSLSQQAREEWEKKEKETSAVSESKSQIPKDPVAQLESKIKSLTRSIKNLSEKKARLEGEILIQKKALAHKRSELKRVQKSLRVKASVALEDSTQFEPDKKLSESHFKEIQNLLRESAEVLEE